MSCHELREATESALNPDPTGDPGPARIRAWTQVHLDGTGLRTQIIEVVGEMDVEDVGRLRRVIHSSIDLYPEAAVLLDLSGVCYLCATAMGVIVGLGRRVGWDRVVIVRNEEGCAGRCLTRTGLERIIRCYGTREEAVARLVEGAPDERPAPA